MENKKEISELLRIKGVLLRIEDIENPHLRKVLSSRVKYQQFSFTHGDTSKPSHSDYDDFQRHSEHSEHADRSPQHYDNYGP